MRAKNARLAAIFNASTALFPSIYLPEGTNYSTFQDRNADYISGVTEEAVRLARMHTNPALPVTVRPFGWGILSPLFAHDTPNLVN